MNSWEIIKKYLDEDIVEEMEKTDEISGYPAWELLQLGQPLEIQLIKLLRKIIEEKI